MVEPELKATSRTKTCAHPQKIMFCIWWKSEGVLYFELFPWGVTITADSNCQHLRSLTDAIQEKDQQDCVKWRYSTITPARTLLTWQKHYTGIGLGSHSAPTLCTWSCALRFSPFPLSIEQPSRSILSGWICAPNMAWWLQLKTTRFLQARNRKITPALADCCK